MLWATSYTSRNAAGVAIEAPEHLAHAVRDDLAVRPGEVRGRAHRAEVPLSLGRRERRARELAVGEVDVVLRHDLIHQPDVVGADLMSETARAAVNQHGDLAPDEPVHRRVASSSNTSSTTSTSRKWLPEPSVPSWSRPRARARWDTALGSARVKAAVRFGDLQVVQSPPSRAPSGSGTPRPALGRARRRSAKAGLHGRSQTGMLRDSSCTRSCIRGRTASAERLETRSRTPQLMS